MAGIVLGALVPHPPVLVPEVGGEAARRVARTARAMEELSREVAGCPAHSLVLVTPHGPLSEACSYVYSGDRLEGSFAGFAAPEAAVTVSVDRDLAEAFIEETAAADLLARPVRPRSLDHGALVPLYFLARANALRPCVVLTPPWTSPREAARYGEAIRRAAERLDRSVALLASGDLSHRLTPDAPAGYSPEGAVFDERLVRLLRAGDRDAILDFPRDLASRAAQDVLPSLGVLLGALGGIRARSTVLSYEGPFGVGYAVAVWRPEEERVDPAPVRVARRAIELFLAGEEAEPSALAERIMAEEPLLLEENPELRQARGAFVSLKADGMLRGCIGTVAPTRATLLEEIVASALAAATDDPRFPPVRPEEVPGLQITVDVLEPPEPVRGWADLDPGRFGVLVAKGRRRGLLLPALEGITDPRQQYALACRKAEIDPAEEGVSVFRFQTRRYA